MSVLLTTDILIKSIPRCVPSPAPDAEVWRIYSRPGHGYFALADMELEELGEEQFLILFEPSDFDIPPDMEPDPIIFPTQELAEEWAKIEDEAMTVMAELEAFNAPGECYPQSLEKRRQEILDKAVPLAH